MNNNSGGQGNQQQLRQNPTQRTGPIPGSGMNALGAHGAMAMPPALAVNNSGLGGVSGVGVFLPGMDVGMKVNTGMKNMMTVGMNAIGQGGRGTGDMNSMNVGMMGGNPSVGSASFSGTSLHQMQQQPNLNAINAMNLSQQQQQQLQQMQLQQLQAQISQQQQMGQHLNQHMQVNQQQHQKNQQQLNQHEMGNNQQQMGKMYQQTGNSQQHQMNQQHQHTTQQMNNAQPQMVSSGNKDNNPQHHLGHGQGQPQARGSRPNSQQSSSPFRWNQGSKTPVAFSSQSSAPQSMQMTGGNATLGFNALGNSSSVNSSHTMNQISNKSNVNVMSNTGSPPNAQQAQQMMQFQLEQQRTHQMQQMSQQQRLQAMHQQHLQQQIQGQQQGNQQIQQPPLSQQQDGQQEQQQQQQFLQNQMQARALAQEQKKRMAQSQQQMLQQIQQQQYQQQQQLQNPKQQEQFQIQQRQQNQQQQNQQYHEQKNQQYQEQDSKIKSQQQIQQQQGRASFTMAQQQNQQQTRRNSSSSAQLLQENLHRNSITANQQHQQDNPLRRSFIMSQHMQLQQQQQQQQQHNKHQNSQQLAQQMQQENSLQKSLTVTKNLQQQQERHSITISQLSRPTSAQSNVARRPSAPIANSPSIQQQYYPNVTPPEQNQHHTQTGGLFESYGWQSSTSPLGLPEQSSTQCGSQRGLTLQHQQQQRQQNQLQQLQQQMQQQLNQQHLTQQQGKESSGNLSLLSSESFFNFNPASCFGGDNNISKGSYENRPSSRGTSTATYISMPAPPLSPLPFGADLAKKPPTPPLMESKPSQAQTISLRHEPTVVDADSKSGMKKAFEVNAETISSSLSTTHENTEGATAEVTIKTPSANTPAPTQGVVPSDRTIKSSVATTVSSQTILTHDYYHNQHSSELPNDQVLKLANACSWEERTVWVARQVLGPGGSNGFSRATSAVQRLKRQRARQLQSTKNKDMNGTDNKDDGYSHPDMDEETLKRETFNPRLAKKMQSELKQGLQFCNLISEVITSILREIDPQHPLLGVQAPIVASSIPLNLMRPTIPLSTITNVGVGTKDDQNPIQPLGPEGSSKAGDQILSKIPKAANSKPSKSIGSLEKNKLVPMSPRFARASVGHANLEAETVAEGNPNGSTLRKSRKPGSHTPEHSPDPVLLKSIGSYDEHGKKLTKKELAFRLFEASRFRTLEIGDYVAAKVASHDMWILARVVKKWEAVKIPYKQMREMSEAKRDSLFREKVYIQDNDDYNGDMSSARVISRQQILPLPRTYAEANDWATRARKGFRVYAMYPGTTALYCATVIDNSTYCRNQDDIIVVEFDGDEDDNGLIPQRHIPARFVTLIPREFPASQTSKIKQKKSLSDGTKKNELNSNKLQVDTKSDPSPPEITKKSHSEPSLKRHDTVDEMLLEMYGESASRASSALGKFDYGEMLRDDGFTPSLLEPSDNEAMSNSLPNNSTEDGGGKGTRDKGKRDATIRDSKIGKKAKQA